VGQVGNLPPIVKSAYSLATAKLPGARKIIKASTCRFSIGRQVTNLPYNEIRGVGVGVQNGFCFLSAMRIETSAFFEDTRRRSKAPQHRGDSSVSLPEM
jgi:hypothetical protein